MYHTGMHPFTGEQVHSARGLVERRMQRALLQPKAADSPPLVRRALELLGKQAPGVVMQGRELRAPRSRT